MASRKNSSMNGTDERVLAGGRSRTPPVGLVERLVLDRDVRRVARRRRGSGRAARMPGVLVDVLGVVAGNVGHGLVVVEQQRPGCARLAEQRVPDGEVVAGTPGPRPATLQPGGLQRGDGEAEPGDRDRERVEVDAVDRRPAPGARAPLASSAGRACPPLGEQPVERTEQEVPRAAGRVDQRAARRGRTRRARASGSGRG